VLKYNGREFKKVGKRAVWIAAGAKNEVYALSTPSVGKGKVNAKGKGYTIYKW